jgi:hypothetical protein
MSHKLDIDDVIENYCFNEKTKEEQIKKAHEIIKKFIVN